MLRFRSHPRAVAASLLRVVAISALLVSSFASLANDAEHAVDSQVHLAGAHLGAAPIIAAEGVSDDDHLDSKLTLLGATATLGTPNRARSFACDRAECLARARVDSACTPSRAPPQA